MVPVLVAWGTEQLLNMCFCVKTLGDVFSAHSKAEFAPHRMSKSQLVSLLGSWVTEKGLDEHVICEESLVDHFFRYLEEAYGCGDLASHVAHGCMMAFDEYVVSRKQRSSAYSDTQQLRGSLTWSSARHDLCIYV